MYCDLVFLFPLSYSLLNRPPLPSSAHDELPQSSTTAFGGRHHQHPPPFENGLREDCRWVFSPSRRCRRTSRSANSSHRSYLEQLLPERVGQPRSRGVRTAPVRRWVWRVVSERRTIPVAAVTDWRLLAHVLRLPLGGGISRWRLTPQGVADEVQSSRGVSFSGFLLPRMRWVS